MKIKFREHHSRAGEIIDTEKTGRFTAYLEIYGDGTYSTDSFDILPDEKIVEVIKPGSVTDHLNALKSLLG